MIINDIVKETAEKDYLENGVPGCKKEIHVDAFLRGYLLALQELTKKPISEPSINDNMR
jgi:hypothetical protein